MDQEKKKKIIYSAIALVVLIAIGIFISYIADTEPKNIGNTVVSGTVEKKNSNSIVVDAFTLRGINAGGKVLRTITIDEKTSIRRQEKKSLVTFQEEQDAFLAAQKVGDMSVKPPVPIIEVPSTINELVGGDYVSVRADRDVEKNETFVAKSILINLKETAPKIVGTEELSVKVVGKLGWKGASAEARFAVDKGDGMRVQIYINDQTQYIKQEKKDEKKFIEEMELFKKSGGGSIVPSPILEKVVSFAELNIGDQIDVNGTGTERDGVLAKKVTILLAPEKIIN